MDASLSTELGARIRELRKQAGLSQTDLAGERLSESYVSLIEAGKRRPTADVIAWLAEQLGCAVEQITGVLPMPGPADVELLIRRGEWETSSGRAERARVRFTEAVELATRMGLGGLLARANAGLARCLEAVGLLDEACAQWRSVMASAQVDPYNGLETEAAVGLCRCTREMGDLELAIDIGEAHLSKILARFETGSAPTDEVVVIGATLMGAYLELGDLRSSRQLADQLLGLADATPSPMATGAAYWNAALAAEAEGRVGEALRLAEHAQVSLALTDDVRNRARLQTAIAGLHLRGDPPEPDRALALLRSAGPVLEQFGSVIDVAYCHTEMGRAHLQLGAPELAVLLATETLESLEEMGSGQLEAARTQLVLAAGLAHVGDTDAARRIAHSAADKLEASGASRQAGTIWTELAELCTSIGDTTGALVAYREATRLLSATGRVRMVRAEDGRPAPFRKVDERHAS